MTRRALLMALAARSAIRLSIGNYGLQSMEVEAAMDAVRAIGYDGMELCCLPGWPSEPAKLDVAARRRIRNSGFPVPTLLEGLNLLSTADDLPRLARAAELAHDVGAAIVQTVLGGKPTDWPGAKEAMKKRLAAWAEQASRSRIQLAVKAHAMQAVDTPEKLIEMLDAVNHPSLRAIYDYGHFQVRELSIEQTMDQLLPRSVFLTVKDGKLVDGAPRFVLPGDGGVDYTRYFAKVKAMSWSGWTLVEITRQLQTEPGYDGLKASRRSYEHLAPILREAGLR